MRELKEVRHHLKELRLKLTILVPYSMDLNSILQETEGLHSHSTLEQGKLFHVGIKVSPSLPRAKKLSSIAHQTWLMVREVSHQSSHQAQCLDSMLNLLTGESYHDIE